MEGSIPQGVGGVETADELESGEGRLRTLANGDGADGDAGPDGEGLGGPGDDDDELEYQPFPWGLLVGYGLVLVCFLIYFLIHLDRPNHYLHFVLQAQAWLDGMTSIPLQGYQDIMPIADTGRGIIPFPPLPAWVLVPFVSIWHEDTNQQLISAVFGAVDVGIAYWMLGRLPIQPTLRAVTALFLGLGTVLFYTSAIGTTWFWAHVVAVAFLLLSVGFALAADPGAVEPRPLGEVRGAARGATVPGGWLTAMVLIAAAIIGEGFLWMADSNKPASMLALAGIALGVIAALLAVAVAGRWRVLLAPGLVLVAVMGVPGLFLIAALTPGLTIFVDAALLLAVVLGVWLALRREERYERAWAEAFEALTSPEALQVAAGLLFGLAVTARLTILLGFPFLMMVGGGGTWMRRSLLAGAGAAIPLIGLLVVTYATSGQLFNPAYDYLYRTELMEYGPVFNYNSAWAISDVRYIPQNLMIMLFQGPEIAPNFIGIAGPDQGIPACMAQGAVRGFFDSTCPIAMPNATGMSILMASPAFLVGPFAYGTLARLRLDRASVGAGIAVVAISIANLMHFSQGWVEFGYRFSNDFVPFALVLVALAAARIRWLWPFVALVTLSIAINFWGVIWGAILAW